MAAKTNNYNIAHRGARSLAPENTMAAFHKAWQVGAHGVETDISVTSDGELILFHDTNLIRTTNIADVFPKRKKAKLCTFTYEEIQRLDAGSWFLKTDPFGTVKEGVVPREELERMQNIRIPLLEELLHFVQKKSWFINIEIKTLPKKQKAFPVVEKILLLTEKLQLEPTMFSISSFCHPYLQKITELRSDVEINALIGGNKIMGQNWGDYEFEIYNANVDLIDSIQLEKALQHGCRVNLYTVNDTADMRRFLKEGVEKMITDFPQVLVQLSLDSIR